MTSVLEPPVRDPASRPRRARRSATSSEVSVRRDIVGTRPVAAVTAALWAAGVGLIVVGVLVMLAWAVTGRGDDGISVPVQASGVIWLVAHHAPVVTAGATISLLPLGLLVVPLLALYRAGRWATRITATDTGPDVGLLVAAGTATYAGIGLGVAQLSGLAGAQVPDLAAMGWTGLVAAVGLGLGAMAEAGLLARARASMSARARRVALASATMGAALAVVAGLVALLAVATRWSTITGLERQVAPGVWDAVELLLATLLYLPNLLLWALSYLAGPGFAVGGGATVDPFSATGALLPGVPILGAVPPDAPAAAPLLLLLPVLVGMVASFVLRRHHRGELLEEASTLLAAAVVVGVLATLLCALSGGALGSARLAVLGPHALLTGVALTGLVGAGALLWSLVARLLPTVWVADEA